MTRAVAMTAIDGRSGRPGEGIGVKPPDRTIADLLRDLAHRRGGASSEDSGASVLIGLAGRKIQSSRTPLMHEREGARLGVPCVYVLIDFDRLDLPDAALSDVLAAAERMGFVGINVTHPFKQGVIPHLTTLSPRAEAIGAVNTVVFRAGSRIGHNTDSWGFAESFRSGMAECVVDRVVQFGAGGAGTAVAHALMDHGVSDLVIIDCDAQKSRALADRMAVRFSRRVRASVAVAESIATANGIVNTSPVGMANYPGIPFPGEFLRPHHWVVEIIYFPLETELLRRARSLGCRTLPGTGMAVCQAVQAFELFTGVAPDRKAMLDHFEAAG